MGENIVEVTDSLSNDVLGGFGIEIEETEEDFTWR